MFSRRKIAGLALVVLAVVAVGCGSSSSSGNDTGDTMVSGRTLAVPTGYKTIQSAVDAAKPGDLILVSPGVYREAVNVTTDRLVIRGLDRNKTILEGDFTATNGIRVLGAKGVAIENMTARDYKSNGFFWTGVTGYRGSYLTAYRNGDYGIYAFDSTEGLIEESYASGSPDWVAKVKASKFVAYPNYGKAAKGYISIQGDHEGELSLRNIRIREIK